MTSFSVNHRGMEEVNDGLGQSLAAMRNILGQLDQVLNHMPQAAGGKAVPLWADKQRAWGGACDNMDRRLSATQAAHANVAGAFHDGDNNSARVMM